MQIVARLRPLLYDYYARMSATSSVGGITTENISSDRASDDILLSHLVYKCLVKMGIWLWNKLEKLSGEEYSGSFNWVLPFFSGRFGIADFLLAGGTLQELVESVEIPGYVAQKPSCGAWPAQFLGKRINSSHDYHPH